MSGGTDTKQIICFKNLLVTAFQLQFKKNAKKCLGMSKAFNNKGFECDDDSIKRGQTVT